MDYWNGTLDWTTRQSYFPFWTSFWIYFWKPTFLKFTSSWVLWMIVIMTIVGYCSVFITKCKYTFENILYCKLSEVEKFCGFSSIIILLAITFKWNRIWSQCNHECFEQIIDEFYNCETSNNLEYTVSTCIRNYLHTELPLCT